MSKIYFTLLMVIFVVNFAQAQFVQDVVNGIRLDSLERKVSELSGETASSINGATTTIIDRISSNNDLAAEYIKDHFEALSDITITDQLYNGGAVGIGRNIIATQLGTVNPDNIYIICAHYDSVAAFCADDNATGVAAVLEVARILSTYETENTIVYALWDQEENGLIGSNFYAEQAADTSNGNTRDNIIGVLNMDMMGYDSDAVGTPGDNQFDIDLNSSATSIAIKDDLLAKVTAFNLDLKPVVVQPGTPASDHKPFWDEGYGAVLVGESWETGDQTPFYHSSADRLATLDLPYFYEMVKLVAAYTADNAGIVRSLSTETFNTDEVSIYPNPVNSILNINATISENLSIDFLDINGKLVKKETSIKGITAIDVSDFSPGVYFVTVFSGQKKKTFKFIKK